MKDLFLIFSGLFAIAAACVFAAIFVITGLWLIGIVAATYIKASIGIFIICLSLSFSLALIDFFIDRARKLK